QGRGAFGVAGEDLPVGPFVGEGAVEPLHFAVLPGAMRADELLPGAQGGHGIAEGGAVAVGEGVVGDDALDGGDAVGGEVGGGAEREAGGGGAFFVRQDLGVGEPGVVVDGGVDVVVAGPAGLPGPGAAAAGPPAAAAGDLAELFDVEVDQLAGPVPFIAHRGGLAGPDHLPGQRV